MLLLEQKKKKKPRNTNSKFSFPLPDMLSPGLTLCQERVPSWDFPGHGSVENNVFQSCFFPEALNSWREEGKQSCRPHPEAAEGAVMTKKPRTASSTRVMSESSQLPLLHTILGTRDFLKTKVFTSHTYISYLMTKLHATFYQRGKKA